MQRQDSSDTHGQRLQKVLAHAGIASRRSIEAMMREGRVRVNGVAAELGQRIGPMDTVTVDGKVIKLQPEPHSYYALNKPYGVVSTVSDDEGRATVLSLVSVPERVYPVGRLDVDSEGLVLLTNDGEMTHRLTHPRYGVPKVYEVTVSGWLGPMEAKALVDGVQLEDGLARAERALVTNANSRSSLVRITMIEGRNREVRRMCAALGFTVTRLVRVSLGPLRLGDLQPGKWRALTVFEITSLQREVGHAQ